MRVAAYQAPLLPSGSIDAALDLIREQVEWCESAGVDILCCPEAILGGLADYAPRPAEIAIDVEGGQLDEVLARLASDRVTTIVGFTEIDARGRLFNAAAVFHKGSVAGVCRKLHPAINRSVYSAGDAAPAFTVAGLTFGIVICRDSTFPEPARRMAEQGAAVLFVPTNNGLPAARGVTGRAMEARADAVARAIENRVWVIRADVSGRDGDLVAYGSSAIVDRDGVVRQTMESSDVGVIVADSST